MVAALSETALERRLLAGSADRPSYYVAADYGQVHHEMRRKGMTLSLLWEEYVEAHPGNWERERRVVARLEHGPQGPNQRFVVTSLQGGNATELYERLYCALGEAENRIKEAQLDLFGRRASAHRFAANQLRLLLATFAYTLIINLRRLVLQGTELARAPAAGLQPSAQTRLPRRGKGPGSLSAQKCCPGMRTNNGGKGVVRLAFAQTRHALVAKLASLRRNLTPPPKTISGAHS
jgi:hypothetical protein